MWYSSNEMERNGPDRIFVNKDWFLLLFREISSRISCFLPSIRYQLIYLSSNILFNYDYEDLIIRYIKKSDQRSAETARQHTQFALLRSVIEKNNQAKSLKSVTSLIFKRFLDNDVQIVCGKEKDRHEYLCLILFVFIYICKKNY